MPSSTSRLRWLSATSGRRLWIGEREGTVYLCQYRDSALDLLCFNQQVYTKMTSQSPAFYFKRSYVVVEGHVLTALAKEFDDDSV